MLEPLDTWVAQGFQTIVSRNVIPDTCELQGTVRTFSLAVLDQIQQSMADMTMQLCAAFGMSAELEFDRNYPPTINSEAETAFCRQVLTDLVGAERVQVQETDHGGRGLLLHAAGQTRLLRFYRQWRR